MFVIREGSVFGKRSLAALDDAHDNPEQPQGAAKDLHDQDFDEGVGILGVGYRAARA